MPTYRVYATPNFYIDPVATPLDGEVLCCNDLYTTLRSSIETAEKSYENRQVTLVGGHNHRPFAVIVGYNPKDDDLPENTSYVVFYDTADEELGEVVV